MRPALLDVGRKVFQMLMRISVSPSGSELLYIL